MYEPQADLGTPLPLKIGLPVTLSVDGREVSVPRGASVMRAAAQATLRHISTLPNSEYPIPESTPDESALGKGCTLEQEHIQQFGAGSIFKQQDTSA